MRFVLIVSSALLLLFKREREDVCGCLLLSAVQTGQDYFQPGGPASLIRSRNGSLLFRISMELKWWET